jgi:hypothetical protein
MGLLNFLKEILEGPEAAFKRLTPELIAEKKRKLSSKDYAKWLRRTITYYEAMVIELRERGNSVSQSSIDKVDMLKKELSNIQF